MLTQISNGLKVTNLVFYDDPGHVAIVIYSLCLDFSYEITGNELEMYF